MMFIQTSKDNNILVRRLENHFNRPNQKSYFYGCIGKDLYDLFDYCIIYPNQFSVEFFTVDETKCNNIWSKIRVRKDYGYCNLKSIGWEDNIGCFCVDVVCGELLEFCRWFHSPYTSDVSRRQKMVLCGF